jgi:predicted transcriptional regulator
MKGANEMADIRMGPAETQFAEMIWENEPIPSGTLAKLAEETLHWKKTTSFTVLKRLCERGIFQNLSGTVTSLISREEFFARHSEQYVQENFGGSLPAFLAAFSTHRKLSDREIDEMKALIEKMRG